MNTAAKHFDMFNALVRYKSEGNDITPVATSVYLYFMMQHNQYGKFQGLKFTNEGLQNWVGANRRTISNAIEELEQKGFLKVTFKAKNQYQGLSIADITAECVSSSECIDAHVPAQNLHKHCTGIDTSTAQAHAQALQTHCTGIDTSTAGLYTTIDTTLTNPTKDTNTTQSANADCIKPEKQKRTKKSFDHSWETAKENAELMAEMREYMITHEKNGRTYSTEKYVDEDLERLIDWHITNKAGKAKGRKLENWKATVSAWQGSDSWIRTWEARERLERMEKLKEETEQPSLNDLRDFFYEKARGKMDAKQATEIAKRFADHYGAANWMDVQGRPIVWKQKGLGWLEKELEGGKKETVKNWLQQGMEEVDRRYDEEQRKRREAKAKCEEQVAWLDECMAKIMGDKYTCPTMAPFIEWYRPQMVARKDMEEQVFFAKAGLQDEAKLAEHMRTNAIFFSKRTAEIERKRKEAEQQQAS